MRRMPGDRSDVRAVSRASELGEALGALRSAVETMRSLGLNEEAAEVERVAASLTESAHLRRNIFRRQGDNWVVLYDADAFRLRHTLGVAYLARLLALPGRELHVLDLAGSSAALASDAGPVVDGEARRAYRERIRELGEVMEDAVRRDDLDLEAACRQEVKLLVAELSRGEGLGGRERAAGSTVERARQTVTKALKSTLRRISAESPALGRHLASSIRTGTYCRYDPDPRLAIAWRL